MGRGEQNSAVSQPAKRNVFLTAHTPPLSPEEHQRIGEEASQRLGVPIEDSAINFEVDREKNITGSVGDYQMNYTLMETFFFVKNALLCGERLFHVVGHPSSGKSSFVKEVAAIRHTPRIVVQTKGDELTPEQEEKIQEALHAGAIVEVEVEDSSLQSPTRTTEVSDELLTSLRQAQAAGHREGLVFLTSPLTQIDPRFHPVQFDDYTKNDSLARIVEAPKFADKYLNSDLSAVQKQAPNVQQRVNGYLANVKCNPDYNHLTPLSDEDAELFVKVQIALEGAAKEGHLWRAPETEEIARFATQLILEADQGNVTAQESAVRAVLAPSLFGGSNHSFERRVKDLLAAIPPDVGEELERVRKQRSTQGVTL